MNNYSSNAGNDAGAGLNNNNNMNINETDEYIYTAATITDKTSTIMKDTSLIISDKLLCPKKCKGHLRAIYNGQYFLAGSGMEKNTCNDMEPVIYLWERNQNQNGQNQEKDFVTEPLVLGAGAHHQPITVINIAEGNDNNNNNTNIRMCSGSRDAINLWEIDRTCFNDNNQKQGNGLAIIYDTLLEKLEGEPRFINFDPTGLLIALGIERQIYILQTESSTKNNDSNNANDSIFATLEGHRNNVTDAKFVPQKPFLLISISEDRTFKVWDLSQRLLVYQSSILSSSPLIHLSIHPEMSYFSIVSKDCRVWFNEILGKNNQQHCCREILCFDLKKNVKDLIIQKEKEKNDLELNKKKNNIISSLPVWQTNKAIVNNNNVNDDDEIREEVEIAESKQFYPLGMHFICSNNSKNKDSETDDTDENNISQIFKKSSLNLKPRIGRRRSSSSSQKKFDMLHKGYLMIITSSSIIELDCHAHTVRLISHNENESMNLKSLAATYVLQPYNNKKNNDIEVALAASFEPVIELIKFNSTVNILEIKEKEKELQIMLLKEQEKIKQQEILQEENQQRQHIGDNNNDNDNNNAILGAGVGVGTGLGSEENHSITDDNNDIEIDLFVPISGITENMDSPLKAEYQLTKNTDKLRGRRLSFDSSMKERLKQGNGRRGVKGKSSNIVVDKPITFHSKIKSSGYNSGPPVMKMGTYNKINNSKDNNTNFKSAKGRMGIVSKLNNHLHNYPNDCDYFDNEDRNNQLKSPFESPITSITYSDDGTMMALGCMDKTVHTMRLPIARFHGESTVYMGHTSCVRSAKFSHNKTTMISASDDGTARLWDLSKTDIAVVFRNPLGSTAANNSNKINSNSSKHYSRMIGDNATTRRHSTGSSSTSIDHRAVNNKKNNTGTTTTSGGYGGKVTNASLFYLDKFVLLSAKKNVYMYKYSLPVPQENSSKTNDLLKGITREGKYKLVHSWEHDAHTVTSFDCINTVHSHIIISATSNKTISILDASVGKIRRTIQDAHSKPIHCIKLPVPSSYTNFALQDYNIFASAAADNVITLWDVRSCSRVARFVGHRNRREAIGISFSPCLRYLATGSEDKVCVVYDLKTGSESYRIKGNSDVVSDVAFNPAKPQLATSSFDGRLKFYCENEIELKERRLRNRKGGTGMTDNNNLNVDITTNITRNIEKRMMDIDI